jgi:3-dehydroquinate dehydratase/shikimate dehydrogenase
MTSALTSYVPRAAHLRLPRICVAVIGTDASDMVDRAEALVRDNPFIEFRLDYLVKPALALPKIKHFNDYNPQSICIATCRRVASGGKF